jgi:hypothetical protein
MEVTEERKKLIAKYESQLDALADFRETDLYFCLPMEIRMVLLRGREHLTELKRAVENDYL